MFDKESFKLDWFSMSRTELETKYKTEYRFLANISALHGLKKQTLQKLLDDSNVSWYWLGFIMGDGSFSKRGQLRIALAEKDKNHLEKIAKYLDGCVIPYNVGKIDKSYYIMSLTDTITTNKILDIFKTTTQKTYHSINIEHIIDDEKLLSFLCGLIDADGNFNLIKGKLTDIRIQCYSSWINVYSYISNKLKTMGFESKVKIDTQGYCKFQIHKQNNILRFHNKILTLNLPILERKWDRVKTIL